jgi:hypothetical protein
MKKHRHENESINILIAEFTGRESVAQAYTPVGIVDTARLSIARGGERLFLLLP